MRSKFFRSIAVAGLLALAGCSENAGSDLVAQAGELVNPEISSDSEGGELPPNGETDIFSSDDSTLPGESSPSGGEQFTDESSSSSEENSEQGGFSSDNNPLRLNLSKAKLMLTAGLRGTLLCRQGVAESNGTESNPVATNSSGAVASVQSASTFPIITTTQSPIAWFSACSVQADGLAVFNKKDIMV